jgi:D-alanyl-D-alanine dipeptidase
MEKIIDSPQSSYESSVFSRRNFIGSVLLLFSLPSAVLAENMEGGDVSINGKKINISDVKKLNVPTKNLQRIMEYPISDEARAILEKMKADESFLKAEDYRSSDGYQILLRKTAEHLYRLAQKYAAMEGYGLAIFSAYRAPEAQKSLYDGSDKDERGDKVALAKDSQHVRGGAMDVLMYKKEKGRIVTLTPDKKNPGRGIPEDIDRLHKYLQLAGFANYTPEPWHNEIGSEEWVEIMKKAGLPDAGSKLYKPADIKTR